MTHDSLNLVIAGLGDQPLAYACFVLARMAQNKGLEVQILEPEKAPCTHCAHVRIGKKTERKPLGKGEADVLVGLEPVDALKAVLYLKKGGLALINGPEKLTNEMLAPSFPQVEQPLSLLEGYQVEHRDTLTLARQLGMPMTIVTILLGMLSKHLPFSAYDWKHAIGSSVPRKTLAVNIRAFLIGRDEADVEPVKRNLMDETNMTKKDDECSDATM